MTIQEKNINIQWLLGHGYTPTEAAEVLGVTASHLRRVLKGAPDRGNALKVRIRRLPRKKTDIIKEEQVTMLRRAANLIAAIAVMALAFLGMVKAGGWYLDTEEQQVRDGLKDPRTAILPVMERPHDDGRHTR